MIMELSRQQTVCEAVLFNRDAERIKPVHVHPEVVGVEPLEVVEQDAGTYQQRERKRELRHDEPTLDACAAARTAATTLLERLGNVGARCIGETKRSVVNRT